MANNPDTIGLVDIVAATGLNEGFWSRVLGSDELRRGLAFDPVKRKYPRETLPFFVWFAGEKRAGNKNAGPASAAQMLLEWSAPVAGGNGAAGKTAGGVESSEPAKPGTSELQTFRVSIPAPTAAAALPENALADLARIAAALEKRNEDTDKFIGREEAAAMLRCSPRSVGRYVGAVRPGVWSRLDVREEMARQRAAAREKR